MKRKSASLLLAIIMLLSMLPFSAFADQGGYILHTAVNGQNEDGHECVASDWYSWNENSHWKNCRLCSKQIGDVQPHTYTDGRCTVCNAVDPNHTCIYVDGRCTICYEVDPNHQCVASDQYYGYNENSHWKQCRICYKQLEDAQPHTYVHESCMELPGQQPCAYFCITSDQDSTFDFLSSLFLSFVFIKLVRYADKNCEGGKLPIPVHVLGEELTACGVIPDLSRKISVIRSRNISMSCVFQNLAGLQNRYPLNQWQEILGNSDVQLFLGCVDELTAKYISDRSGEVSVHVQSKAKQLGTWRISNYTPEYRETSGVGKRKLLTMDEVLRLPISKALIIIRGRKLLQVDKCDYTEHPESKKMISCKASAHIPEWQKQQPKEVEEVSPAPIKKPGRKKKTPASNVVPTDKDSIMSKN